MGGIDRIFGAILLLVLVGALIWFFMAARFGVPSQPATPIVIEPVAGAVPASAEDVWCQCFDQAYALAGEDVGVMSSQYRTGFESCRAVGGAKGGEAWTAGWNARISSAPFQANCRAWLKRAI